MLRLMITRLTFNEEPTIAFGGASFGKVGSFEKIQGRAFGELDPGNPLNSVITDLTLAPRNARGVVEYAVDFYILRPVNPSRGNNVMVFDVTNRGNKMTYLPLSFPFRAPGRYLPNNDPCGPDDAGTGLLMRQGNAIVIRCGTGSVLPAASLARADSTTRPELMFALSSTSQSKKLAASGRAARPLTSTALTMPLSTVTP